MLRATAVLALVLAGLVAADRSLSDRAAAAREEAGRVRKLIPPEVQEELVVAGIRVETAAGEDFLYARSRGVWRLVQPPVGTWADANAVLGLMQSLVDAEGVVLTTEKLRAKSYGFGSDIALRVTLHGTQLSKAEDGDVLYSLDFGYPVQGTSGSYVRPYGTHEVWTIDQNPRSFLARPPGSNFPPMLDPYVIPGPVSASTGGYRRVEVLREGGESWAVERRAVPPGREHVDDGHGHEPPTAEWVLERPGREPVVCDEIPVTGYTLYLQRIAYDRIVGPRDLDPSVAESPAVRVVLHPVQGDPFELLIGPPARNGSRPLVNTGTGTAFGVDPETFDLLVPSAEAVSDVEQGNRWHDFIQVNPFAGVDPLLNPVRGR